MGNCCSCQSVPEAPDVILPDPQPGQDAHFVVKSLSRFNEDYEVYADKIGDDTKWLFLNQEGKMFSDDARIELENFNRGHDPASAKKGEILWRCRYESRPSYHDEYDADSSDDDEIGNLFEFMGGHPRHTHGLKFKMETQAIFEPIKGGGTSYRLKCKAKGFAKRRIHITTIRNDEDDTHDRQKDYDDEISVKKISYKIKDAFDQTLDKFKLKVDGMESRSDLYWESNAFHVQKNGGFFRDHPTHIQTKGGGDPGLALIMGHFVSTGLTPQRIAQGYSPDWRGVTGYESDYYSDD
uniref:Uncharacterized protein n=1 Tax=Pyramimonas obovata TaxID=1411642 RepID=A0A7S0WKS5_9CHLO|mmetsp:Transcript_28705/g.62883  ORF Transcript_28705/g.62883 Transcript_28705/m.62883 type:complete len:295 (+) Transcript_28705:92-976(+)